jgi:hypothetical protein
MRHTEQEARMNGHDIQVVTVYMPLEEEGTPVWRPVAARPVGGDVFELADQAVPEEEIWRFPPGSRVRCERRVFASGEQGLAVVALAG